MRSGAWPAGVLEGRRETWLATKNLISVPEPVFSDFPYLTLLSKRANITTISNFSNLNKVYKARLFMKKNVNLLKGTFF